MKIKFLAALLLAAIPALSLPARAADPAQVAEFAKLMKPRVDYAADQTFTGREGKSFTSHVNHSGEKERREMAAGQGMVSILRMDKKVMWNLMPAQQTYMEISLDSARMKNMPGHPGGNPAEDWKNADVTLTKLGGDTVNGIAATKYEAIIKDPQGASRRHLIWLSDQGLVVRMQGFPDPKSTTPDFQMSLSNIKIGPQDAALFEVPADYKKFDMPGMGMGGPGMSGPGMGGMHGPMPPQ